jgi:hypothetical protein
MARAVNREQGGGCTVSAQHPMACQPYTDCCPRTSSCMCCRSGSSGTGDLCIHTPPCKHLHRHTAPQSCGSRYHMTRSPHTQCTQKNLRSSRCTGSRPTPHRSKARSCPCSGHPRRTAAHQILLQIEESQRCEPSRFLQAAERDMMRWSPFTEKIKDTHCRRLTLTTLGRRQSRTRDFLQVGEAAKIHQRRDVGKQDVSSNMGQAHEHIE